MSIRLRIATEGHRGATLNRQLSIATSGHHPIGIVVAVWKEIYSMTLSIMQKVTYLTER